MSRFWVTINGKTYCFNGNPSTCFRAQLEGPPIQESDLALNQLQEATARINGILEEVAIGALDAGRELAFLALRDTGGRDRLQLGYVDAGAEIDTYFD